MVQDFGRLTFQDKIQKKEGDKERRAERERESKTSKEKEKQTEKQSERERGMVWRSSLPSNMTVIAQW